MIASSIFLSGMLILAIFNWIYLQTVSSSSNAIILNSIVGFIAGIIAVGVISGVTFLGTGLNTASIQILFGAGALLNILFQIDIAGFSVGLGLINNLLNAFALNGSTGFGIGLGYAISMILSVMILISGIMIIVGSE